MVYVKQMKKKVYSFVDPARWIQTRRVAPRAKWVDIYRIHNQKKSCLKYCFSSRQSYMRSRCWWPSLQDTRGGVAWSSNRRGSFAFGFRPFRSCTSEHYFFAGLLSGGASEVLLPRSGPFPSLSGFWWSCLASSATANTVGATAFFSSGRGR